MDSRIEVRNVKKSARDSRVFVFMDCHAANAARNDGEVSLRVKRF